MARAGKAEPSSRKTKFKGKNGGTEWRMQNKKKDMCGQTLETKGPSMNGYQAPDEREVRRCGEARTGRTGEGVA